MGKSLAALFAGETFYFLQTDFDEGYL